VHQRRALEHLQFSSVAFCETGCSPAQADDSGCGERLFVLLDQQAHERVISRTAGTSRVTSINELAISDKASLGG
jgi:hypothetical protein